MFKEGIYDEGTSLLNTIFEAEFYELITIGKI